MDNYSFSFKKKSRPLMKVTFPDGRTISVFDPPVKDAEKIRDEFARTVADADKSPDELFKMAARVLGYNLEKYEFSEEDLRARFTVEDIAEFLHTYAGYISSIAESKN